MMSCWHRQEKWGEFSRLVNKPFRMRLPIRKQYTRRLAQCRSYLIGRTWLQKCVQIVRVVEIAPDGLELVRYLKIAEVASTDSGRWRSVRNTRLTGKGSKGNLPKMLQSRHQFGVETAHRIAGQKTGASLLQMLINSAQLIQQTFLRVLVLSSHHQLEFLVCRMVRISF